MKRTQIYLEEAQAERLAERARRNGFTASHVIREAIDAYLADSPDQDAWLARQRAALDETFGSIPDLPDGVRFVREMRSRDSERLDELERRWRGR